MERHGRYYYGDKIAIHLKSFGVNYLKEFKRIIKFMRDILLLSFYADHIGFAWLGKARTFTTISFIESHRRTHTKAGGKKYSKDSTRLICTSTLFIIVG